MSSLLIGDLGTPELLIILAIVVLVFGASKLPELARGSGRALRIFKAETKGLNDDDDEAGKTSLAARARGQPGVRARRLRGEAGRRARGHASRRHHRLTAPEPERPVPCPSSASSTSCAESRATPSAMTAGWRCPTTSGSCVRA